MLGRLLLQVGQIDVAALIARHDNDLHAGHLRRCGVRTVRRRWDQAHVAVRFTAAGVVGVNDQQTGVLTLRTCVRLQAHGRVAGGGAQHLLELVDHLAVADGLVGRRERVDVRELGPRHRQHFCGGIELHGARAQRDHRAVEREVLVGQAAQVAQHFVLGMVCVEHRVRQVRALADERGRIRIGHARFGLVEVRCGGVGGMREDFPQRNDVRACDRLVQRDAQSRIVDLAQVDAVRLCCDVQVRGARAGGDGQRVEERVGFQRVAERTQAGCQRGGQAMHALGDALQALRAVVDGVHRRHHAQQHLRGTDVRGGLLAADVLFARLQSEAVGRIALRIDRHADQSAGHRALERVAHGHVAGVRAAETERHAKTLRVADHDVGTPFARRGQQRECQQIGGGHDQTAGGVHGIGQGLVRRQIAQQRTVGARVLQQHAKGVVLGSIRSGAGHHLHADRFGARAHDFQRLRQHVVGHE